MQRKTIIRWLVFAVLIVVLVALALPKINLMGKADGAPEARQQQGQTVKVMVAKPAHLSDDISVTGTLLPDEKVELTTETAGKITDIYFEEGQLVQEGQLLVKISDEVLQSRLAKLKPQLKLAREKENRYRQLLEKEAVSNEEYDNVLTNLQTLQSDSAEMQAMINQTEIRAPFRGMAGLRQVSKGSYVTSNTSVASLVKMQPLKLEFSVPEKYVNSIHEGQQVRFSSASVPGDFTAKVYAYEPMLDVSTRSLKIRAMYPNLERQLIPGLYASVQLELKTYDDAIMIPSEALIPGIGGSKVFLVKNGKASEAMVKTGNRNERQVQVTNGISGGDTVVVSGILELRDGMPVEPELVDSLFAAP